MVNIFEMIVLGAFVIIGFKSLINLIQYIRRVL